MTIAELLDIVTKGGVIATLLIVIVGGFRKWYVWYWQYNELLVDRNFWRGMALSGGQQTEKAIGLVEQVVKNGVP